MSTEIIKQALEELQYVIASNIKENLPFDPRSFDRTLNILKQGVEQADHIPDATKMIGNQDPVAYMGTDSEGNPNKFRLNYFGGAIPLYTSTCKQPLQVNLEPKAWYNATKDTVSTDPVHRNNPDCIPLHIMPQREKNT